MTGECETCGRLSELFQLPGRKDNNCAECNADISILVLLYRRLVTAEGDHSADLEAQLVPILHKFLERSGPRAYSNNSIWPEATVTENYIN